MKVHLLIGVAFAGGVFVGIYIASSRIAEMAIVGRTTPGGYRWSVKKVA